MSVFFLFCCLVLMPRTGLLSSFFYNAAAIDNVPSTTAICQQMILDIGMSLIA
jgi:hypothetical protein